MLEKVEELCRKRGLKMTEQRRVIARVIGQSDDHPDVEQLHQRAAALIRASVSPLSIEQCACLKKHIF